MSARLLLSAALSAERRRTKERLEASVGGLCELELLKHRQEARVRDALSLGDGPAPSAASSDGGDAKVLRSSLHCTPWGVLASLGQQVADPKVNAEVKSAGCSASAAARVSPLASDEFVVKKDGSPEPSKDTAGPRSLSSPQETVDTETAETWLSDLMRQTTAAEALGEVRDTRNPSQENPLTQKVETYIFGLIQRRSLPTRPSKTRTSLAHDARGVAIVRQSSVCHKENKNSSNQVSVQEISGLSHCSEARPNLQRERHFGTETPEDAPPPCQQLQHQPGPYHKPRQANTVNTSLSNSSDYPPSRVLPIYPDSSDSDPEAPQHFQNYQPPFAVVKSPPMPSADEQLVSAEYIPAQPGGASSRAYAHYLSSSHKGSAVPKASRSTYSSERSHHYQEQQPSTLHAQASRSRGGTKKGRSHEDKNGSSRKQGKKTCRTQSDSLQRGPERKYNTVERDGGAGGGAASGGRGSRISQSRSKKQQEGSGGYHRCQSTVELSQDEADPPPAPAPVHISSASNQRDHGARRTRRSHPAHTASYAYPHHNLNQQFHHREHVEYQLERSQGSLCPPSDDYRHPGHGESESSMSEADSPDSSSSSSDSDESGGLVWPQQLSPQVSLPSPPAPPGAHLQPKAFVKIKASHALKKKILRFRTGSLKVMTTV